MGNEVFLLCLIVENGAVVCILSATFDFTFTSFHNAHKVRCAELSSFQKLKQYFSTNHAVIAVNFSQ